MSNKSKAADFRKMEFVKANEFYVRLAYDGDAYGRMELKRLAQAAGWPVGTDVLAFFRKQYNQL